MNKCDSLILKGFNPDPCAIRVGSDYYVAVSTFEWFPGVVIYHSRDLVNYEICARPLSDDNYLNMLGCESSAGIWAPCLSYNEVLKKYFLVFTVVKWRNGDREFSGDNYFITCDDITKEWSEPIHLNSSGFDPSFYHEDDKIYLINPRWDFRCEEDSNKYPFLKDIVLQEFDYESKKLVGDFKTIFTSTDIGLAEAPHIYKKNSYYYLVVAEGGTSYSHAVTIARSKNLHGPYEVHPNNPILTSSNNKDLRLQKSGHASIIDDEFGNYYLFHLCARVVENTQCCILGRETAIQNLEYRNDWFELPNGNEPKDYFYSPYQVLEKSNNSKLYQFDSLDKDFFVSRARINMSNHEIVDNKLRVYGYGSLQSTYRKSHYAIKLKHFKVNVETKVDFKPTNMHQYAGLTIFYDERNYYNLRIGYSEELGVATFNLMKREQGKVTTYYKYDRELKLNSSTITLRAKIDNAIVNFEVVDEEVIGIGAGFDMTFLSDDFVDGFTGTFVGINCSDLSGQENFADFWYLNYEELY